MIVTSVEKEKEISEMSLHFYQRLQRRQILLIDDLFTITQGTCMKKGNSTTEKVDFDFHFD